MLLLSGNKSIKINKSWLKYNALSYSDVIIFTQKENNCLKF